MSVIETIELQVLEVVDLNVVLVIVKLLVMRTEYSVYHFDNDLI